MTTNTLTVCFPGTDCWPDHGLVLREPNEKKCYNEDSGYIPSKIYNQLSSKGYHARVVPGCGVPYNALVKTLNVNRWFKEFDPESDSYTVIEQKLTTVFQDSIRGHSIDAIAAHAMSLIIGAPVQLLEPTIKIDETGMNIAKDNNGKAIALGLKCESAITKGIPSEPNLCWLEDDLNQYDEVTTRKWDIINLIGHSRGGIVAVVTANFIARYLPDVKVNIIGLDPVAGTGTLPEHMCTLAKVKTGSYTGIYAIDETSTGFNGMVPKVLRESGKVWDPLTEDYDSSVASKKNYHLIYSRGRHATIPGSKVSDGTGDIEKLSDTIGCVGKLVSSLCWHNLQAWETGIQGDWTKKENVESWKKRILESSDQFYEMRNTHYTGGNYLFKNLRGITSTAGSKSWKWSYLESYINNDVDKRTGRTDSVDKVTTAHVTWEALTGLADEEFLPASSD
ncbi:MAG: hypothetical protein GY919_01040 [Photobacterium aquimaris]|nr:hypothetical protein [Photobacterium aquimaris]